MAEAAVGVLIGKLGATLANEAATYATSLLCKEASALEGLFGEIRKAEAELEIMKAYLHDVERFKDTNETTSIFIKKVRNLAFQIEDVVDEFMYKLEDKHGGFITKTKKRIKQVKIWHRLGVKLHNINADLEDAAKRRDRYAMTGMERYDRCSNHHTRSTDQISCFMREEDLVGIKDNVDKLKWWLVSDLGERKNKITTVWGMGGAGKTSLVNQVYKIVKTEFDHAAWVTVYKSCQIDDLLKKIAIELDISVATSNMELRRLVEVIHNHLEGKRYIMVLDDVWEKDVWLNIMDVFPTNCISRFVLTSRKNEVASLATGNCAINVEPLGENDSRKLFWKLAFRNTDDQMCPSELQYLAAKFLQKCEGLPIAIACIGRLLSCKPPTYSAWNNVYEELELQSTQNFIPGVDVILKVSLEDLPYELKNCFLHCAMFPEGYGLKRRRLIRHWITAGFIKGKENKTPEQVAEGYLNELVNRSLLQVTMRNELGRVRCCQMHDVVRHLALEKAEKECFCKVYEGYGTYSVNGARRLSIHSTDISLLSQSTATHFRAIHAFTSHVNIDSLRPILTSSNLLQTLDLQGTQIKVLPNEVFTLFNLRFLGLRSTGLQVLPEAVGRLQNLEVLDAHATSLQSLPKNVTKLKKLRYLYASVSCIQATVKISHGIKMPRGIKNLAGLHALQDVKASSEILSDVAALTELRTFRVSDVTSELSSNLCNAIMNMNHLVHLSIVASNENEVLPLETLCLPKTLRKIGLKGKLEKKRVPQILSCWSDLSKLTTMYLKFSKLDDDSFCSLVALHGLRFLRLDKAYDGKKMCFSAQWFPRLHQLQICGAPQLNQVEIEEGALGSLVQLELSDCPQLKHLPYGIEYLKSLEELSLEDTAEDLIENLRRESEANECNEELKKISHIRKVVVVLTKKKLRERIR